jgi:FtsH-binding integral membrane protein
MATFPSSNAALPRGGVDSRSVFITRTYTHLVAGILGFVLVELGLFESGLAEQVVVAEALIFVPLLYLADAKAPGTIDSATLITALGAGGLMVVAHRTRKDFSFLRAILMWGGVLALVAIIGGVIFGFQLGTWFSVLMIGFAGAAVLYDTSNIIHYYPEDRYVSAAMQLFASIALMFWYVLRLLMGNRN